MHKTVQNFSNIKDQIKSKINELKYNNYDPQVIAVSKTFSINHIMPLLDYGHFHYGENKVQEALEKWTELKNKNKHIKLHMLGKLQTNKVKYAVKIFDFIHSLDNEKLARKISDEQKKNNFFPKLFIQINLGNETQKSGINISDLEEFYKLCTNLNLKVVGTMCLPPNDDNSSIYFKNIKELNDKLNLKESSMGMSHDYLKALEYNSTYLRIGTSIFGKRS
tara:strand:- start:474 stop:1136 length:663 start_codon:yes stop_codon:yes gene_type:complete